MGNKPAGDSVLIIPGKYSVVECCLDGNGLTVKHSVSFQPVYTYIYVQVNTEEYLLPAHTINVSFESSNH